MTEFNESFALELRLQVQGPEFNWSKRLSPLIRTVASEFFGLEAS